jgi:guanosine monophosphate reductase
VRIEEDVKLDFKDVLIRPKRSTLGSRREVDLTRHYKFKHSGHEWSGVPVMAANMDGVGTLAMAHALYQYRMFTCLVKNIDAMYIETTIQDFGCDHFAVSTGTSQRDFQRLSGIINEHEEIKFICIDVANGYSEAFGDYVEEVREAWPDKTIIAGNVVTADMTQELILRGADIVKVGIGPGCFAPGQKVKTDKGLKNIEDIKQGEKVLTHNGSYKTVTNTFKFDDKKSIVKINDIKATPNHEFYVLHKKHRGIVTDDNIHQYAEWIEAKDLTKDYLLLKHK